MKKSILLLTAFTLIFLLVACSKTTNQTTQTGSTVSLSTAAELLVGTFKLEGTELAVTSDQAKQLLPLWQVLQSLSTSNTAATEEIQAVVDQIKSTMTSAQTDEITGMNLTQQDMMNLMRQNMTSVNGTAVATPMSSNGLPASSDPFFGDGMPSERSGPSGALPGGAPPSGGMVIGGNPPFGDFPSGGDTGMVGGLTGMSATPQSIRSNGIADQLPAPLLNALIELLQKKVQS